MSQTSGMSEVADGELETAEDLANELAGQYIDYLSVDISEQKTQVDVSVEELLTHLEEVSSVLEIYLSKSDKIEDVPTLISSKRESLEKLYDQIDELDRFVSDMDKTLDQLDNKIKEYENLKRSEAGSILQVIDLIPRLSRGMRSLWPGD